MWHEKAIIPDRQDGNILVIHPEFSEFEKYVKISEENNFWVELDISFLHENINFVKDIKNLLTIHLKNDYSEENIYLLIEDIKFILWFNPRFIILHDDVLWNINPSGLMMINKYLKNSGVTLLIENYKYTSKNYNNLYDNLLLLLPWIKKCIDRGHCILMKEDIDNWLDSNVIYFHFNNNFWVRDTHNSIYNWKGVISKEIMKKMRGIKYISLEINVNYRTYYNNIIYMLQNKIPPFNWFILNLPIYQKFIISEVKKFISFYLSKEVIYAFIYWSFAKRTCHEWSDLDLFLCTKRDFDKKIFIKDYMKLCKNLWFTIDDLYPIELFSEIYINGVLNNEKIQLSEEDMNEIKSAHLMKSLFLYWNKKKYFKNIRRFNEL